MSGLGARALHWREGQAGAGEIVQGAFYVIRFDGMQFVIMGETIYRSLPITRGGHGGRTAAEARTNLGTAPAGAGLPVGGSSESDPRKTQQFRLRR